MFLRLFSAPVAAVVLAAILRSAGGAEDGSALLAKHRAFAGWQFGDGTVTTLALAGERTLDGRRVGQLSALFDGAMYRIAQTSEGRSNVAGFNGRTFWVSNDNGFTIRRVGDAVRPAISYDAVVLENTTGLPGQVLRSQLVNGVPTVVVRVVPHPGVPIDLYVDPATGAYRRFVLDPDGIFEQSTDILAYAEAAPGKKIVSSWRATGDPLMTTWTSIRANEPVPRAALQPSDPSARWVFSSRAPLPIEVADNRIVITATINGVKGRFLFDTGAYRLLFTDSFLRRSGAREVDRAVAHAVGGSLSANVFRVDSIDFGSGNHLDNVLVDSGLDEETSARNGIDGLFGFDFLAAAIVDMDLDAKTMSISDPAKIQPNPQAGVNVVIDATNGIPQLTMKVDGRVDVRAALDTGNPRNVFVADDLVLRDKVPLLPDLLSTRWEPLRQIPVPGVGDDPANGPDREQLAASMNPLLRRVSIPRLPAGFTGSVRSTWSSERFAVGAGGRAESIQCGTLQRLSLGPVEYRPVPACRARSFKRREILVGYDFLRNFNIVYDYPDSLLLLAPRKT